MASHRRAKQEEGLNSRLALEFRPEFSQRLHALPVHLQSKLELTRIVGGSGRSGVGKQRADGRNVKPVGDVKHVDDRVHANALPEGNALGYSQVVEDGPGRYPGVAA